MEKNQARTLAYNLAKELDYKELDETSGGAVAGFPCQYPCFKPTGGSGSYEAFIDVTIDW